MGNKKIFGIVSLFATAVLIFSVVKPISWPVIQPNELTRASGLAHIAEKSADLQHVVAEENSLQNKQISDRTMHLSQAEDSRLRSFSTVIFDANAFNAWQLSTGELMYAFRPLPGQGLDDTSVRTLIVKNGVIEYDTELLFQSESTNQGQMQVWQNGILLKNLVVSATGDVVQAARAQLQISPIAARALVKGALFGSGFATYKKGDWFGNFNTCLSNAGVAAWLVTAITIACAIACVGTAGLGCTICITAAAGVTGGTIGYCIGIANKYS